MNVHKAVIAAKAKYSGATVHYVNNNYDEGNIISQTKVEVLENDTPETLSEKVQKAEKLQILKILNSFVIC